MKFTFSAVLIVSLATAGWVAAAEKAGKPSKKTPSTLPPTSKMIVMPPSSDTTAQGEGARKLFSSEMSGKDLQFFTTAVEAGRFQAYLVELLKTKAESEQIKSLGAALAGTQEQENQQIARLAAAKGWTVSIEPTAAEKALGAELAKQTGSNFDKAVMDKVIAAAQKSVSAYEEAAQSTDKDIKNFSEQMLPLAQEKLRFAEKMTGAGKEASQLFRTGAPPKATPTPKTTTTPKSSTPSPTATPKSTPGPKSTVTPAPAATPKPADAASLPMIPVTASTTEYKAVPPAIVPSKRAAAPPRPETAVAPAVSATPQPTPIPPPLAK